MFKPAVGRGLARIGHSKITQQLTNARLIVSKFQAANTAFLLLLFAPPQPQLNVAADLDPLSGRTP